MTSTLNPHAAPFVPLVYRAVEDFSAEWWRLVKTSPWFRDFWLRECFNEEKLEAMDSGGSELTADIFESFFSPLVPHQKEETKQKKKSSGKLELMAWGADKWMETRCRSWAGSRCSEKAPKIVSLRVSPRTIQQPR